MKPALTWVWVPGYEGLYKVSTNGDVMRVAGLDSIGRPRNERLLKKVDSGRGYHVVFPE